MIFRKPPNTCKKTTKPFAITINIDAEPNDHFINPNDMAPWTGFEQAFVFFQEQRIILSELLQEKVNFLWLFRCDKQIAETYGDAAWGLNFYENEIHQLLEAGDEIGTHTHLYRWEKRINNWVVDFSDQDHVEECLEMGFQAYKKFFGYIPKTNSLGGTWLNTSTCNYLKKLGYKNDLSIVAEQEKIILPEYLGKYTGTQPSYKSVLPRPYLPSDKDFLKEEFGSLKNSSMWLVPLPSADIKYNLISRGNFSRIIPQHFLSREKKSKIFLSANIRTVLVGTRAQLSRNEPNYTIFAVRSSILLNSGARKRMLATIQMLTGDSLPIKAKFVTCEALVKLFKEGILNS